MTHQSNKLEVGQMLKFSLRVALMLVCAPSAIAQNAYLSESELYYSSHLGQIGLPAAWRYAAGSGVSVAVLDSGISASHSDLRTQISRTVRGVNFTTRARYDTSDLLGHGSHVAGIIVAAANGGGVVGVAPFARVVPIKVIDSEGYATEATLNSGLRYVADNRLAIANMSLAGGACCLDYLRYATDRGVLIVAAAGNEGEDNPAYPARYAKESWAKGRIIAVGSVDANNKISVFSNRAGDTRNYFLVAPGEDILSTVGNSFEYQSGTSMATPMVSGAAALVKSRWSYLRAEQIADVLFKSATDLGAPGVDPIYGRGLLNIARAMQPIGNTVVPTASGASVSSKAVAITPSMAYAAALKNTTVKMVSLDEIGRDFPLAVADTVKTPRASALVAELAKPAADPARQSPAGDPSERLIAVPLRSDLRLAVSDASGSAAFLRHAASTNQAVAASFMSKTPVLTLVPTHTMTGLSRELGRGLTMKLAMLNTAGAEFFTTPTTQKSAAARATVGMISHVNDNRILGLTVAALKERDSLLGGGASGFGLKAPASMVFTTAEGLFDLGSKLSFLLQVTTAQSSGSGESATTLGATGLRASAAKLGLIKGPASPGRGTFAFSVEQPLRVSSGALKSRLPTAMSENGEVLFEQATLDLTAKARELQYRVEFGNNLGKNTYATGFLQLNKNPGHDPNASNEASIGVKMTTTF